MNDIEKLAGIFDRLKRTYEKTKEKIKGKFPFNLFDKRTDLSGKQIFDGMDGKSVKALKANRAPVSALYRIFFGPDARFFKHPQLGPIIMLKSNVALKAYRDPQTNGQALKYVGNLGKKGILEKIKDFFLEEEGRALTSRLDFFLLDKESEKAILADGGDIKFKAITIFPADTSLVSVGGRELILLKDGSLLSMSQGLSDKSVIKYTGNVNDELEDVKEEQQAA